MLNEACAGVDALAAEPLCSAVARVTGLASAAIERVCTAALALGAVAACVAAGGADGGLGVLADAVAYGLGFVPVRHEPFDLVLKVHSLEHPLLAPFFELMSSGAFQASVRALGGYDTSETGKRIL